MPVLEILDVLLGLVFIYLLLSLVCTSLNEGLAALLHARGATLERGIRNLLEGVGKASGRSILLTEFYQHPFIQALRETSLFQSRSPSYISARTFTNTVLDLLASRAGPGAAAASSANPPSLTIDGIRRVVADLDDHLRKPLLSIIEAADKDIDKLRRGIENWFNESMERVSAVYKRRTQLVIFAIALIVTLATNADTIGMSRALGSNAGLRQALVEQAKVYAASNSAATSGEKPIRAIIDSLRVLGLPLGWKGTVKTREPGRSTMSRVGDYLAAVSGELPGLLVTVFALSLGAPFWFDMLNRIINIRASGKAPDERKVGREAGA